MQFASAMSYKDKCRWKPHSFLLYHRIWNISNKIENSLRDRFNDNVWCLHQDFITAFRSPDSHNVIPKFLAQLPPTSKGMANCTERANHNFHVKRCPGIPERATSASCSLIRWVCWKHLIRTQKLGISLAKYVYCIFGFTQGFFFFFSCLEI